MTAPWSTGANYFHPDYGLKAGKLADAVCAAGPVLADDDDRLWTYADGVWRPDPREIRRRVVGLLGERLRDAHVRNVRTTLLGSCQRMEIGPVSAFLNLRDGMLAWGRDPDPVLLEHHPEYLSTVQLPLEWDPRAECPEFDAFLEQSVPEDDRLRAWQLLGYLLMSGNPLQRLFMLTGSGGNGKGVYLNVVRALLGRANFAAVPLQDFSDSQFATAELFGKLANVCGDIDANFIQNTGRIKELSGDDEMKGERKNEHPFYFRFWGKAIFSANAIPGAADSSRGWTRRWEVIPFPYEPTKPDPDISKRVTTPDELAGILVKAVDALRQLMRDGEFSRGESADKAHSEFAEKANKVRRWINDPDSNVTLEEGIFNKGTALLKAFREWDAQDSGGHSSMGTQRFNELAKQAGLTYMVRRGNRGYVGLRIDPAVMVAPRDMPYLNYETRVHQSAPLEDDPDDPTLF